MIFIDLKKAFDTVDHQILLEKMQFYGITGHAHKWFSSYLDNRKQYCRVNGTPSSIENTVNSRLSEHLRPNRFENRSDKQKYRISE